MRVIAAPVWFTIVLLTTGQHIVGTGFFSLRTAAPMWFTIVAKPSSAPCGQSRPETVGLNRLNGRRHGRGEHRA